MSKKKYSLLLDDEDRQQGDRDRRSSVLLIGLCLIAMGAACLCAATTVGILATINRRYTSINGETANGGESRAKQQSSCGQREMRLLSLEEGEMVFDEDPYSLNDTLLSDDDILAVDTYNQTNASVIGNIFNRTAPVFLPSETPARTPPTSSPSSAPTNKPSSIPTPEPTVEPTRRPHETPAPTNGPTGEPSPAPTRAPTHLPTGASTANPSQSPSFLPTAYPTGSPTEMSKTVSPSGLPSSGGHVVNSSPSASVPSSYGYGSLNPSLAPSLIPPALDPNTLVPTRPPTEMPSTVPPTANSPTLTSSVIPSSVASVLPTLRATQTPITQSPTMQPSTSSPTQQPTTTTPSAIPSSAGQVAKSVNNFSILDTLSHDTNAFCQGLTFDPNFGGKIVYESTGLYGQSDVRKVRLDGGEVLLKVESPPEVFGEGLAFYREGTAGRLIHLTWKNQRGFIYDSDSLEVLEEFRFSTERGEGWGVTYNPTKDEFIVTDGSNVLHFWDRNLQEVARVEVTIRSSESTSPQGVDNLNEVEWDEDTGTVLANVWRTDTIVRIDPATGAVITTYDLSELFPNRPAFADVMNGIAISPQKELWVTGKLWPLMFQIKFHES